ncbi:phospholipase-like protein [Tanacetum coccineum]
MLFKTIKVIELWIQLMWHFRPKEADWSLSTSYFSRLLEQNKLVDWIFNDITYPVGWADVYIPLNIENTHWFLAEFKIRTGVITFYDTLGGLEPWQMENPDRWLNLWEMIIEQLSCVMSKHGIFKKKDIDPEHYNITFKFSNCAPKHASLYEDCGVWVCIIMYTLANGLSMDFPPGSFQTALAYREKNDKLFLKIQDHVLMDGGRGYCNL